jgi:hypothetical protein
MAVGWLTGKLQPVAALMRDSFTISVRIFRNGDNVHKLGACQLATAPGRNILRITRNPERIESERPRQRNQQTQGARREMAAPMVRVDTVADVPGVEKKRRIRGHAEVDAARNLPCVRSDHIEMVGRDLQT